MRTSNSLRWLVVVAGAAMLLAVVAACSSETVEVPGETVVVEKIVTETVEVPGETVVVEKEVIRTVEVPGETVTKEVVKEVMVPGETVVVKEEVIKTVEVPGQTVVKEVVKTVEVPGQTVVVEKEVVKTIEVPGQTVVVEKEVVKTVAGPERIVVREVPGKNYVTDPTNGKVYSAPEYGGTLTFASAAEAPNTDQTIGGMGSGYAVGGVLEKLGIANWGIDRGVNDLRNEILLIDHYTGALAESWEVPDPQTYIFNIRKGVYWHNKAPMNGRELTADDVVYNFHRYSGTGSGFTEPPTNAFRLVSDMQYESITATDKYTVVFKLKKQPLDALKVLIDDPYAFINAPEAIEKYGDVADWRNLVGTGPWMLTDWVEGSSFTWAKNPDYWGYDEKYPENRLPYVDQLVSLIILDPATRLSAMRSGKVDYIGHNAASNLKNLDEADSLRRTNPELRWNSYYYRAGASYAPVVTKPPFDDIMVRHAIQMALDLETISNTYYKGLAVSKPMGSIQPLTGNSIPFEEWPEEVKQYYRYDPEAAEKLLDEAGYPRGADGIRFKTAITTISGASSNLGYHEIAVGYWREIGVDVEIRSTDWPTFVSSFQEGVLEGMGQFSQGLPIDALVFLPFTTTGHELNVGGWSDPVYDALIEDLRVATTQEEFRRMSKEADLYQVKNHWYIWSPLNPWFNFTQPWVQGYDGDFYMGVWNKNAVYARLWIDQALKKEVGH